MCFKVNSQTTVQSQPGSSTPTVLTASSAPVTEKPSNNATTSANSPNNATTTTSSPAAPPKPKDCSCLNGGTCLETNSCKCPKEFYGPRCELVVCAAKTQQQRDVQASLQCKNGYCMRNTLTDEYFCKCNPGHTGALCERPSCLGYCYNGGACDDGLGTKYEFELETNITANLSCKCPESPNSVRRYYGMRCEFDKCFDQTKTCAKDCWLDDSCSCRCNKECDDTFCDKKGKCSLDSNQQLTCKYINLEFIF